MGNEFVRSDTHLPVGGTFSDIDDKVEICNRTEDHLILDDGSEWLRTGVVLADPSYTEAESTTSQSASPIYDSRSGYDPAKVYATGVWIMSEHLDNFPVVDVEIGTESNQCQLDTASMYFYSNSVGVEPNGPVEFMSSNFTASDGAFSGLCVDIDGFDAEVAKVPNHNYWAVDAYTYGHVWAAYSGGVSGSTIEETRIFGDAIDPSSHAATYPIFTVAGDIGGVEHYMGHLYVVSITDKAIRKYTYTGSLVTSYPIGTHLSNPKHIARMGRGFLVCEESGNSALFDLDFNYLLSATLSSGPAKLIGLHKHWRYSDGEMITIGYFDDSTVDAFQVAEVTGVGDAIEQVGVAGEPLYKRIR